MNRQDFEQQFEAISEQIWEFAETCRLIFWKKKVLP